MSHQHTLKLLPEFWEAVKRGDKTFEIRKNDRGFQVGDSLIIQEWTGKEYTGWYMVADVTYLTDFEQKPGYVVLGIRVRGGA